MTDEITYHADPNVIKYIGDKVREEIKENSFYLGLCEEIPSGADINNYTTPGNYRIATNKIAATVSNLPQSDVDWKYPGVLRIYFPYTDTNDPSGWGVVYQKYEDSRGREWWRYWSRHDNYWYPWQCQGGEDSIIAEGTSGNWTYWKFANGLAFLRYHEDSKTREWTQDTSINGGIYYNKEVSTPFAIKNATAFGSGSSSRYTWVGISGNSSSSNGGNNANFMWFRSARSISFTDELNATVIATWK